MTDSCVICVTLFMFTYLTSNKTVVRCFFTSSGVTFYVTADVMVKLPDWAIDDWTTITQYTQMAHLQNKSGKRDLHDHTVNVTMAFLTVLSQYRCHWLQHQTCIKIKGTGKCTRIQQLSLLSNCSMTCWPEGTGFTRVEKNNQGSRCG